MKRKKNWKKKGLLVIINYGNKLLIYFFFRAWCSVWEWGWFLSSRVPCFLPPYLILSGRSSESRGPIASPGGLGGTLSRIYGSMMGVQSEMYESCCRPCSPIIWGDMPRNAEKRRETPRTQASESASRDAKMVTMENQVRSFTFGHTRAAAVRSQRRIPAPHAEIP